MNNQPAPCWSPDVRCASPATRPTTNLGLRRLRAAYTAAVWRDVQTALEPEAAGNRFVRGLDTAAVVLIGDFWRRDQRISRCFGSNRAATVACKRWGTPGLGIAERTHSIYDRRPDHFPPVWAKAPPTGCSTRTCRCRRSINSSFARWHRLSLMRAPRTMRDIEAVARTAEHPDRLRALLRLIRDELGYALYRAVSDREGRLGRMPRRRYCGSATPTSRSRKTIARADFEHWIAPDLARIDATVGTRWRKPD